MEYRLRWVPGIGSLRWACTIHVVCALEHCKTTMFADDCVLYQSRNTWDNVCDILQSDINNITHWFSLNGFSLNVSKTKTLIIGTQGKLKALHYPKRLLANGQCVDFVRQYDYLGTIFDAEMYMSLIPSYENTIKCVSNKIFILRKIRKYIDYHTAISIYKQTILHLFDYSGFLLLSLTNGQKNDLQIIQNDALRYANQVTINDGISKVELHQKAKL